MSTREIITRTCDDCMIEDEPGGIIVRPHRVSMNGVYYDIDLCATCTSDRAIWLSQVGRTPANPPKPKRSAASRKQAAEIRAWALAHNFDITDRGRIPDQVVKAWENR